VSYQYQHLLDVGAEKHLQALPTTIAPKLVALDTDIDSTFGQNFPVPSAGSAMWMRNGGRGLGKKALGTSTAEG